MFLRNCLSNRRNRGGRGLRALRGLLLWCLEIRRGHRDHGRRRGRVNLFRIRVSIVFGFKKKGFQNSRAGLP